MAHNPKEQLINTLESALYIFKEYNKYCINSIAIDPKYYGSNSYENGGVETEIRTLTKSNIKGGILIYKDGLPHAHNGPIYAKLPRLPYLYLTKDTTEELLNLLKTETKSTKIEASKPPDNKTPQTLSITDAQDLYLLSTCHDVMYLQKGSQIELLIDSNTSNIISHDNIQSCTQPFISDFYIKYNSSHQKIDLRNKILLSVNILRYECSPDAEYVNLPNNCTKNIIRVSNSGSPLLKLNMIQYKQYMKIHPKYLYQHKYISIINGLVEYNPFKHCLDNKCTIVSKYYFYVKDKFMKISYGQPDVENCALIPDIIKNLIGYVVDISYTPSGVTNIIGEIEEVKQLILLLNTPLKIEFIY